MKTKMLSLMILFASLIPGMAVGSEEDPLKKHHVLTLREQGIIPIAAFTADGDLGRLVPALNRGLDDGLSISEIKEIMVHLYAYTGFPRSLNALNTFMKVVDERKARGIEDVAGKTASPIPEKFNRDEYGAKVRAMLAGRETDISGAPWQKFAPAIDTFLKEHLFADIFVRDVLSYPDRELVTIAALANMEGTGGQLGFHLGAAMNAGLTPAQVKDFVSVLGTRVSMSRAQSAGDILDRVLEKRN